MQSSAQTGDTSAKGSGAAGHSFRAFSIISDELAKVKSLIGRDLSDCSEPVLGLVTCVNTGAGENDKAGAGFAFRACVRDCN